VKTSANTQSIYTAIAQLTVEKIIVLPQSPPDQFLKLLTHDLGIHVLTFTRSEKGQVSISGIETLRR
jgi:hypothetical protein